MQTAHYILLGYLLAINCAGLLITRADKQKARRHEWRTPEKAFWLLSLAGGGLGVLWGFYAFRHKTKHGGLVFTVALCATASYAAAFVLWRYLG